MSKNPVKLKIAWLYPDILQGVCDGANIEIFSKRAFWRDIEVEICKINANDKISSSKYDFYYIGGSNIEGISDCAKYILQNSKELKIAAKNKIPMLAIDCGFTLFGNSYQFNNQETKKGLGILNVESSESEIKYSGNIFGTCEFLNNETIAGYKNQIINTHLNPDCEPFITLEKSIGNNKDKKEGAIYNNVIGTYITSPLLAHNPHLCDFLIEAALKTKYQYQITLTPLCDDIEWYAHNYIVESK